jgi:hypothetical protein
MVKKMKVRGGGILDDIKGALGTATSKVQEAVGLKSAAQGVQETADATGLTTAAADTTSTLGVAPEPAGQTTTGGQAIAGRRRRRTAKSKKSSKKTMRRRH